MRLDAALSKCIYTLIHIQLRPLTSDFENLFTTPNSHVMNICAKFHWNPSANEVHIASCGRGVNGL